MPPKHDVKQYKSKLCNSSITLMKDLILLNTTCCINYINVDMIALKKLPFNVNMLRLVKICRN